MRGEGGGGALGVVNPFEKKCVFRCISGRPQAAEPGAWGPGPNVVGSARGPLAANKMLLPLAVNKIWLIQGRWLLTKCC